VKKANEEFEKCKAKVTKLTSDANKCQEAVNTLRVECEAAEKDRDTIEQEFKKIQEDNIPIPEASCPPLSPPDDDTESWTGFETQENIVGQKYKSKRPEGPARARAKRSATRHCQAQDPTVTTDDLNGWTCKKCNYKASGQTCVRCSGVGGFQNLDMPSSFRRRLQESDVRATHAAFRRLLPKRQAADKTEDLP